jgi:acetyl esterase/lipase
MRTAFFAAVVLVMCRYASGQDGQALTTEEASKKVDQQVTVQMKVQSSGGNRNRYLNSAASYSANNNFTIFIPETAVPKFGAAKIERPEEFFYGKTIRVTGTVALARLVLLGEPVQRPQIVVNDPEQIKVIEKLSGPPIVKKTHIYKRAGQLGIRADSYRFLDRPKQPVVVWIHGGALINGAREPGGPPWLNQACRENGWVLVSLDYRLAPETKLPDIIADIEDAFHWIRTSGPELFQADPDRIAVVGGSAGGYLTLTSGYRVEPRPKALVSLWGYGDLVGPWYGEPSPHYTSKLTAKEADELLTYQPVSDSRDRQHAKAGLFYTYCRQHGLWPKMVAGWDPRTEADKFSPYLPVKNVTSSYPPTLLIHGDKDTDVPVEQSRMMAAELKKENVDHQLITIPGAEHGLADGDRQQVQAAYEAAVEFLKKQLGAM